MFKKTRAFDEFKSNLLLLVQNLYPEGLPLSKLSAEYKKYFKDSIKTYKLYQDLGVPANLGNGFWPRMFEGTILRDSFSLHTNAVSEEKVIKSNQGRNAEEMKLLAQLASYSNIQSLKYSKKGKGPRKRVPVCHKCKKVCVEEDVEDDFDHYESQNSSEGEESEDILKLLKERDENELMVGEGLTSINNEAGVAGDDTKDGLQLSLPEIDVNETIPKTTLDPMESDSSSVSCDPLVQSKTEAPNDEEEIETEGFLTKKSVRDDPLGNLDKPGHRNQISSPIDLEAVVPVPVPKFSTRVLINHLGEVKIIKFLAVEQTCPVCKTVFPDEADLKNHRPYCGEKEFPCSSCGSTFETEDQVLGHRIFCSKVERGTKRSAAESGIDKNHEDAEIANDVGYVGGALEIIVKQEVNQDDTLP